MVRAIRAGWLEEGGMDRNGNEREKERIRRVTGLLYEASRSIRVLAAISWPSEVRAKFFAQGAMELPQVSYEPVDKGPTIEAVQEARRHLAGNGSVDQWMARQANTLERSAHMLAAVGTPAFFGHARELYGEPTASLRLFPLTSLELAEGVRETIGQLARVDIEIAPPSYHSAEEIALDIERAVRGHFGDAAPSVELVDELSSNALASASAIRIRRDARFTDRDAGQLLNHEAYIHVATSLNGRAQTDLPILAAGHPGTTRTQEGLAVFAEIISGTMELDRMQRLADRVIAIQMAIDGADFLQVYHYFLDRSRSDEQAFESARRVFRGGVLTGGAPFTKDIVYLFGLLQVGNFIRATFAAGRADVLRLLFCGKLDLQDLPVMCKLHAMGLLQAPVYLPPWINDPRYLLALLTYSTFMNKMDIQSLQAAAEQLLADAPVVKV